MPRGKKELAEQISPKLGGRGRGGERQDRPGGGQGNRRCGADPDRTSDGRPIRMLTIADDFTRQCLAIDDAKWLTSEDFLERLSDLFVHRGVPEHIRSDNGKHAHSRVPMSLFSPGLSKYSAPDPLAGGGAV